MRNVTKKLGRPTADGVEDVKRYLVTLDAETVRKARNRGKGSLSVGLRRCVDIVDVDEVPIGKKEH